MLRRRRSVGLGVGLLGVVAGVSLAISTARADTANPPQNTSPPSVTGSAAAFETVSCDPGQWTPTDVTFQYQWLIDDDQVTARTPATQTWTLGTSEVKHQIACRVTATDPATGLSATATSAFVTVTQGVITNTALPVLSGTPSPGETVSCSPGQWSPTPDSYSYQWLLDGLTIQGATASSYAIASSDLGHVLTCQVVATIGDNLASGNATSAGVTVSANPPPKPATPVNTAAPVISGSAAVGLTVSCSTGAWTNNPTGFAYQWRLDGVQLAGETASTHAISASEGGHEVACAVTASNADGSATAVSSPVAIAAAAAAKDLTPPVVLVPPARVGKRLVSRPPAYGLVASCDPGTWSGSPALSFEWFEAEPAAFRSGKKYLIVHRDIELGQSKRLTVPDLQPGVAKIFCRVAAKNAAGIREADSALRTVGPVAPALAKRCSILTKKGSRPVRCYKPGLADSELILFVGGTVTCTPGTWTHYPTKYRYAWFDYGPPRPQQAKARRRLLQRGQTYVIQPAVENHEIGCDVTASNGAGSGTASSYILGVEKSGPVSKQPPFVDVQSPAMGLIGREGGEVVADHIHLACMSGRWNRSDLTFRTTWNVIERDGEPIPGEAIAGDTLDIASGPGQLQYDLYVQCVIRATTSNGEWTDAFSGQIHVWNGCVEATDATRFEGEDGAVTMLLLEADYHAQLYGISDAKGFFGSEQGLFGLWGLDPPPPERTINKLVYTFGPNCLSYQHYWEDKGFTVKQQSGQPPGA